MWCEMKKTKTNEKPQANFQIIVYLFQSHVFSILHTGYSFQFFILADGCGRKSVKSIWVYLQRCVHLLFYFYGLAIESEWLRFKWRHIFIVISSFVCWPKLIIKANFQRHEETKHTEFGRRRASVRVKNCWSADGDLICRLWHEIFIGSSPRSDLSFGRILKNSRLSSLFRSFISASSWFCFRLCFYFIFRVAFKCVCLWENMCKCLAFSFSSPFRLYATHTYGNSSSTKLVLCVWAKRK